MSPSSPLCTIFIIIIFVCEMSAPLGTGGLGTQPFKVSETFCAPGCFEPLLAQGMIMLNRGDVLLELANLCIGGSNFLVLGSKAIKLSCNSPFFELLGMFQQYQELRTWSSKYCSEPMW
jgi:hypothetical protein